MADNGAPLKVHKNEQFSFKTVPLNDLPSTAILIEALKPLEQTLLKRGFLKNSNNAQPQPLWFIAETERNIFLWRNGLSLSDKDKIEFWVEVPRLIEKLKLRHPKENLTEELFDPFNCDINGEPITSKLEHLRYLDSFQSHITRIYKQAFELSLITRAMRAEVLNLHRPIVLLPIHKST